ncbi:MAG: hypothetical protein JWM99_4797, partial [Verrucomicrobiales bacterium]|nr:hypothetical protein [Verrucomicrobiales bacterium]
MDGSEDREAQIEMQDFTGSAAVERKTGRWSNDSIRMASWVSEKFNCARSCGPAVRTLPLLRDQDHGSKRRMKPPCPGILWVHAFGREK